MGNDIHLLVRGRQLLRSSRLKIPLNVRYRFHSSSTSEKPPVSDEEFRCMFAKCDELSKVGRSIGVAFSGGPDSTSLLFLLRRLIANEQCASRKNLLAIHIDHGLQSQSGEVSERCAVVAEALGVQFKAIKIPWGIHPFPPLPAPGKSFETIARDARYHIFMTVMREQNINSIAFGHHCDDQVETAIQRLSKGSSVFGLAGMRPLRRWGMGFGADQSSLGWAGYEGMRRWIIRPLLTVPKERLVATCEANGLDYVLDQTNFQPAITERNSIRHDLKKLEGGTMNGFPTLPTLKKLLCLGETHRELGSIEIQSLTLSNLRFAVSLLSTWIAEIDKKGMATLALRAITLPTIQSTILLSCDRLRSINDNTVRVAMVRRILRFVSPRPWGSPAAEAGGRQTSLQAIVTKIWGQHTTPSLPSGGNREAFVVGAGVQWTPVTILPSGEVRLRKAFAGEKEGWLVHRQPPILKTKDSSSAGLERDPLNLSITDVFRDALSKGTEMSVLYDNRFIIHVDPTRLRPDVLELFRDNQLAIQPSFDVFIVSHSRYYLPRIIIVHPCNRHAGRHADEPQEIGRLSLRGRVESPSRRNNKIELTPVPPDAFRIDYARVDDALDDIPTFTCHVDGP